MKCFTRFLSRPSKPADEPPNYETMEKSTASQPATRSGKIPVQLSPELERKLQQANTSRILDLVHYRSASAKEGGIASEKEPIKKIQDAIMLPRNLSYDQLKELLHSRMELKMRDMGLRSLEKTRDVIVIRGLVSVVQVVDDQSWRSGQAFLAASNPDSKAWTLEYGIVTLFKRPIWVPRAIVSVTGLWS